MPGKVWLKLHHKNRLPGVDVMIKIFCNFSQKPFYNHILAEISFVSSEKRSFFANLLAKIFIKS
jgi:hypothetical protein